MINWAQVVYIPTRLYRQKNKERGEGVPSRGTRGRFLPAEGSVLGDQRKSGRDKMPVEAKGLLDVRLLHGRKAYGVCIGEVMVAILSQQGPGVSFEICVRLDYGQTGSQL